MNFTLISDVPFFATSGIMDASAFKVNLLAHGKNCSDKFCVLPLCVNWKLACSRNNSPPTNKRNRNTTGDDDSRRNGKLQRNAACKELTLLDKTSQDSEDYDDEKLKKLLEDLEDLEEDVKTGKYDFQYSLIDTSGDASQNANLLANQSKQDDLQPLIPSDQSATSWNQLSTDHQLPYGISNTVLDINVCQTKKATTQVLTKAELYTHKETSVLEVLPDISTVNCTETDFLEQFIPIDPYVCPVRMKEPIASNYENAWSNIQGTVRDPSTSTAIEEIVQRLKYNKQELHEMKSRPKELPKAQPDNTNKLFGILSEILRLFEGPTTVDLEVFYIRVLQKALEEIRGKVLTKIT